MRFIACGKSFCGFLEQDVFICVIKRKLCVFCVFFNEEQQRIFFLFNGF
jgi:hypothetical protein